MDEQLQLDDETIPITLRRAWDRALRTLASRVNKPTFEAHIRTLRPVSLTETPGEQGRPATAPLAVEIVLGVPSAFTREWVEKRHAPLIAGILEEILDRDVRLRFAILPKESSPGAAAGAAVGAVAAPPRAVVSPSPGAAATGRDVGAAVPATLPESGAGLFGAVGPPPAAAAVPKPKPGGGAAPSPPPTTGRARGSGATGTPPASRISSGGGSAPTLNERYTFDTFVVGPSNRLAQAGALAVAQAPGQAYNPLFLYGPSGLGKTHLMHAIGNQVAAQGGAQQSGAGRVAYISGEAFTTHFITSLREHRTQEFQRQWRNVDVLLVDDIQFIAGKERTKEEFFHTFNALYQTGKQIVISSDRSPRDLRAMDERLRSRFECGLIADIAPPNLETRLAILQQKADTERMRIPDDVLMYMARLVQSNIRTLEGALVKLIAYASLVNSPVTTQLAADILERYYIAAGAGLPPAENAAGAPEDAELGVERESVFVPAAAAEPPPLPFVPTPEKNGAAPTTPARPVTADMVRRVVARRFNLPMETLTGQKRDRDTSHARHIAMHLMRELTTESLPGIGHIFGGRSHSTVLHACERIRDLIPFDDDLKRLVDELVAELELENEA